MGCKYDLEDYYAGDCAGCPATFSRKDSAVGKVFLCKIEEGLMSINEVISLKRKAERGGGLG